VAAFVFTDPENRDFPHTLYTQAEKMSIAWGVFPKNLSRLHDFFFLGNTGFEKAVVLSESLYAKPD
jgi:hypothetical protein